MKGIDIVQLLLLMTKVGGERFGKILCHFVNASKIVLFDSVEP